VTAGSRPSKHTIAMKLLAWVKSPNSAGSSRRVARRLRHRSSRWEGREAWASIRFVSSAWSGSEARTRGLGVRGLRLQPGPQRNGQSRTRPQDASQPCDPRHRRSGRAIGPFSNGGATPGVIRRATVDWMLFNSGQASSHQRTERCRFPVTLSRWNGPRPDLRL